MGRPLKENKELKNDVIYVRISTKQKEVLIAKANKVKLKLGPYLRESALSSDDTRLPRLRHEMIHELKRIGVNINQMQHHINEVQKFGGSIEYSKINDQLTKYRSLLQETINKLRI